MRILVTGAGGMIGRAVVSALNNAAQHEVIACYHTMPQVALSQTVQPQVVQQCTTACDLLDASAREALLHQWRPECLIHLAWCPVGSACNTSALNLAWLDASAALIRSFAELGGRRFIGCGSVHEYGPQPQGVFSVEHSVPRPINLYGLCKFALGNYLMAVAGVKGISALWPRLGYVIGPGCATTLLLGEAMQAVRENSDFTCRIHPETSWDILDVRDLAQLYSRAVDAFDFTGTVNFATGRAVNVRQLLTKLFASCQDKLHYGPPLNAPVQVVLDNALVRQQLGLSAFRDVISSCDDLLEEMKAHD